MPSTRATTPPSSPEVDEKISQAGGKSGEAVEDSEEDEDTKSHFGQLTALLEKSAAYVKLLKQQMDEVKVAHGHRRVKPKSSGKPQSQARPVKRDNAKKRTRGDRDSDDERESKRVKGDTQEAAEDAHVFEQPALVTGATLKDYQLEGVAWMAGLYQNGISGILADEMGLGKTLQAIAFHAFLRERTPAPFMVVCPLSVLQNWVDDFIDLLQTFPCACIMGRLKSVPS
ncbi:hypothetical protein A0H81_06800 [Grifola frondosa]|uniref:SNF2 N-terminal domain-containing protein n=1 Tax=Grifola frondosa TaxID=5627 RepID=A0A1C7M7P2_GRIFR|nr:hypothetical protein A0H81_06800 [Grifola frondosa]